MQRSMEKLRGTIEKVFYAGPKFSAGRLRGADGRSHSFAGSLFAIEGQQIALAGSWETHPDYGRQFKVEGVEIEMPAGAEGLAQFIANHPEVKGIGPMRAAKLTEAFGENFEATLLDSPELMAQAARVPLPAIEKLREVWLRSRHFNATMTWLSAFGLTHHQVTTLVDKLGNNALAILQNDPYRLMREIKKIGFKKIDQIARQMGTSKEHAPRIRAGILHCIHEALGQGDCWVELEDLVERANLLLIMDCLDSRERIEAELDALVRDECLACTDLGGRFVIALPYIHQMESDLTAVFAQAGAGNPHAGLINQAGTAELPQLEPLNEKQRAAVMVALTSRISLISGGAGTGKTYTIATLTAICEAAGLKVVLAAPTGKAAKRMQETSGREAGTIHRLLGYDGTAFAKGADDPIDADVLIVDEVSMIDVPLAWHLFEAIELERTAVVLVGDHNQLPPVGAGNLLRDLVQSRAVPTTILDRCVRQAGLLKENSTAILAGEVRRTAGKRSDGRADWYLVDQFTDPSGVSGCLREMFENILAEKLGFDLLRDVQVLTPTHKGQLGTQALNEDLQRLVQRKLFGVEVPPRVPNRRPPLLKGDKVIQTRNNYDLGVMNGAVGFVKEVTDGAHVFSFDGDEIILRKGDEGLGDIQLAYAISIHKAQGSEFPCAIVVIHKSHSFMHHRNLFYTGVTRAKQSAIILGDRWGVRNCAEKVQVDSRKTFLSQSLRIASSTRLSSWLAIEDLVPAARG